MKEVSSKEVFIILSEDELSSDYIIESSDTNISLKTKFDRLFLRYFVPIFIISLAIIAIISIGIFVSYDFVTKVFNIKRMIISIIIELFIIGIISCKAAFSWLKYISNQEDE